MWKLLRWLVAFGLFWHNAKYHWTPNPYVVGLFVFLINYAICLLEEGLLRLWNFATLPKLRQGFSHHQGLCPVLRDPRLGPHMLGAAPLKRLRETLVPKVATSHPRMH